MYLYRALNKYNLKEYEATGEISARSNNAGNTFLSKVIDHVANGSNELKDDCWLSATKLFYICAEEYSIPQTGKYNTAKSRKSIAVIDTNYWTNLTAPYNESWTCLCEGKKPIVNYMDKSQFPPAVKTQTGGREINGEQLNPEKQGLM